MPQLRKLFMYGTKQSLNDEVILFLLILPKFFFLKKITTQLKFYFETKHKFYLKWPEWAKMPENTSTWSVL